MITHDTDDIENRADMLRVRLPRALREELQRRAQAEGESVSTLVRRALRIELRAETR